MRVLLAADFYPPQVGGLELHVQRLARGLQRAGHRVRVVASGTETGEELVDDIAVLRLRGTAQRLTVAFGNAERRYPPPLVDPELALGLRREISRFQPDVVHAHGWLTASVVAADIGRSQPLVVTLHDYGTFCSRRMLDRDDRECTDGFGAHCLGCAAARYGRAKALANHAGIETGLRLWGRVDRFIAVSEHVRRRCAPYLPQGRTTVIPNFVDPDALLLERDRTQRDWLPERFLLYVGVLAPLKGVDILLAAYQTARQAGAALPPLLLLGRAHPDYAYASDPARGVQVVVNPPRGLVVEAMATADGLIVPSVMPDPCPTTVLEGLAFGRHVIAAEIGGIPELLAGRPGGRLVPAGDVAALAAALASAGEGAREVATAEEQLSERQPPLALNPRAVVDAIVREYELAATRQPIDRRKVYRRAWRLSR